MHRSNNLEFMFFKKQDCESSSGVEHHLAKVRVAGSNPVFRSKPFITFHAEVVELVDTLDLKSSEQ